MKALAVLTSVFLACSLACMTIRKILTIPDPRLRLLAKPVDDPLAKEVQQLIDDMAETMYDAPGVGLAAPQVGVSLRLAITDTQWREEGAEPLLQVWINPVVTEHSGLSTYEEGCLSVPKEYADVERAAHIHVCWQDRQGQKHEADFEGFQAVALQHEFDHLDGRLFIDYLTPLKRRMIERRVRKRLARDT